MNLQLQTTIYVECMCFIALDLYGSLSNAIEFALDPANKYTRLAF